MSEFEPVHDQVIEQVETKVNAAQIKLTEQQLNDLFEYIYMKDGELLFSVKLLSANVILQHAPKKYDTCCCFLFWWMQKLDEKLLEIKNLQSVKNAPGPTRKQTK